MKNNRTGQTILELAIFGAVLIFIIGVIIRQSMGYSYLQNQNLKAMRMAMKTSFEASEGRYMPGSIDHTKFADITRNRASVVLVEDRLTATSAKYATVDRSPQIATGAATHSLNLAYSIDTEEAMDFIVPTMDLYVNNKHIPLTIAKVIPFNVTGTIYKRTPNHPAFPEWCSGPPTGPPCEKNLSADERFDLDRDGVSDVPILEREHFSWQWYALDAARDVIVDPDVGNKNTFVDVDGDLKEELIISRNQIMDYQSGDIDTTLGTSDSGDTPGLTDDMQMYTFVQDGTYLLIEEGKLYGDSRQFVRMAQRNDHVDIIQRVIQLSNDTGNFCKEGEPSPNGSGRWTSIKNPVEVCSDNCFSKDNITRTCMDVARLLIFVRSRVWDKHGRKYITDRSQDDSINFLKD